MIQTVLDAIRKDRSNALFVVAKIARSLHVIASSDIYITVDKMNQFVEISCVFAVGTGQGCLLCCCLEG